MQSKNSRRRKQPEKAAPLVVEADFPLWKKFSLSFVIVALMYLVVYAVNANADDVPVDPVLEDSIPAEAEEPKSEGFFRRWVNQKIAETDEDISSRIEAVQEREAAIAEREVEVDKLEASASDRVQQIASTSIELQGCSLNALNNLKEVKSGVASTEGN